MADNTDSSFDNNGFVSEHHFDTNADTLHKDMWVN